MPSSFEEIFVSYCEKWNLETLKSYLENKTDLAGYLRQKFPGSIPAVKAMISLIPPELKEEMSKTDTDRILLLLKQKRPDLYREIVYTRGGAEWLKIQTANFKRLFL